MNKLIKITIPFTILTSLILAASPVAPAVQSLPNHSANIVKQQDSQAQALPHVETIVNLGVPAGNGTTPKHLALNSQAGQLYILSEGVPALKEGNGLSVYDIARGEITEHVKINDDNHEALDLQFDPEAQLIYALWKDRRGGNRPILTIIDSKRLRAEQNISDVEAFVATNDRLYTANADELLSVNLPNNSLAQAQRIKLPPANITGPMAVSSATNRLYLARNIDGLWRMEIFEANTLTRLASYPSDTEILNILPLPDDDQVLVIAALDSFRAIYRLTTDGELADLPFELGPRFGAEGIALSQDSTRLYFSNGELVPLNSLDPTDLTGPALLALTSSSDLSPLSYIPLPTNFVDVVINDSTGQAFALYPFDNVLYVLDLTNETAEIVSTAIELRDVLVDTIANEIFVSDSANRIRRLKANTFELLAEVRLEGDSSDFGFKSSAWAGELALDRNRNHLYVSGSPALVLEADSLAKIAILEPGGQVAPDPDGDKIYLSHCGLTIFQADSLTAGKIVPGTGPRPDGLSPNPCVGYSQLDAANQLLYSLVPNGTPGSNGGSFLQVYDLSLEPTLLFTDTDISIVRIEPDGDGRRAFVNYVRHSNKRLRTLEAKVSGEFNYTHQLMGIWGTTRYSPTTNHLYLGDRDHNRLLTLDADTLSIIAELPLPPNHDYRLVDLDPMTERLYLIGFDGQLLVAAADDRLSGLAAAPPPTRAANGDIVSLVNPTDDDILARIKAEYDGNFDTRLYRSADNGQSWTDLSQTLPSFPIQDLAVSGDEEQNQIIFVASLAFGQSGGLYKSIDGGQSWAPAMAGLHDVWVESLFMAPDFDQNGLIFAKTSHAGLHQSVDGGQSWTPLAPLASDGIFPTASSRAAVTFDSQGTVLASQSLETMTGIFRAKLRPNGTLSDWQQLLDVPVDRLAFGPDDQTVLAFGDGFWRSADGGRNWEAGGAGLAGIENLQPDTFLFSPNFADDNTAYFFFKDISGDLPGRLFRSTDAGQSWQSWLDPAGDDGNSFTSITMTAEGDFIFGDASTQLTQFSALELRWTEPGAITDIFPITDLALSSNFDVDQTLFVLSIEHGLFRSTNGGRSWQLTNFPARTYRTSFTHFQLALSPDYSWDQTLYVATGRSLHRSTDGGQTWEQLHLSSGRNSNQPLSFRAQKIALSPNFSNDQTLLASTGDALYRSTNGGAEWQPVLSLDEPASGTDILTFVLDGDTGYARFGYGQSLFTSSDGGQSWQAQLNRTADEYFSIISAATAADGTLTAAMEFSTRILQTNPQTQPWREVGSSLPAALSALQAVAYGADDILFAAGQGGIFYTTDNGQSWLPITSLTLSANITNLYTTGTYLLVTSGEGQIFISDDSGGSWTDISLLR